jgi:DNA-binding Xre family transcriptional regulator
MLVADALRRYRADHNLSFSELSKEVAISVPNLELLEGSWLIPRMGTLRKIAKLLQWTPEEVAIVAQDIPDDPPRLRRQPAGGRAEGVPASERAQQPPGRGAPGALSADDLLSDAR